MRNFYILPLVLAAAVFTRTAEAKFVLTIDSLSTSGVDVIIIDDVDTDFPTPPDITTPYGDENAADGSLSDGKITFDGMVGGFDVVVTTGLSKPVISSIGAGPLPPRIFLNNVSVTGGAMSSSSETLVFTLTDTDFLKTSPSVDILGHYSTTLNGDTVSYQSFVSSGGENVEFSTVEKQTGSSFSPPTFTGSTVIATPLVTHPGGAAFSSNVATPIPGPLSVGSLALTQVVAVTHTSSSQVTGFSASTIVMPEPISLGVWAGLVACFGVGGYWARRRRRMNG